MRPLTVAWDKVKDSKDYVSHELVMGGTTQVLAWAYQMRAGLAVFIELLEARMQLEILNEGRVES